jgi:hypothetical protein
MRARCVCAIFLLLNTLCFAQNSLPVFPGTNISIDIASFLNRDAFTNAYYSDNHSFSLWYDYYALNLSTAIEKCKAKYLSYGVIVIDNELSVSPQKYYFEYHSSLAPNKKYLILIIGDNSGTTAFCCSAITGVIIGDPSVVTLNRVLNAFREAEIIQQEPDYKSVACFSINPSLTMRLFKSTGSSYTFQLDDKYQTIISFRGYIDNTNSPSRDVLAFSVPEKTKIHSIDHLAISKTGSDIWRRISENNGILEIRYRVKNGNKILDLIATTTLSIPEEEVTKLLSVLDKADLKNPEGQPTAP